jgi:hypothetical protein
LEQSALPIFPNKETCNQSLMVRLATACLLIFAMNFCERERARKPD